MNDDTGLMDIESIKQLKARYCRYLDTKDWDRWRDLFTDDFVGDTTEAGGTVIFGVDEFMAYTRRTIGKPSQATVHHVHAPEIELTSATTARGIWALNDIVPLVPALTLRGFCDWKGCTVVTPGAIATRRWRAYATRSAARWWSAWSRPPNISRRRCWAPSTRLIPASS